MLTENVSLAVCVYSANVRQERVCCPKRKSQMSPELSWTAICRRLRLAPNSEQHLPTASDITSVKALLCRMFNTRTAEEARVKFTQSMWARPNIVPTTLRVSVSPKQPYQFRFHPEGEHPYYEAPAWTWHEDDEDYWYEEHLYQLYWRKRKRDARNCNTFVGALKVNLESDGSDDERQCDEREHNDAGEFPFGQPVFKHVSHG